MQMNRFLLPLLCAGVLSLATSLSLFAQTPSSSENAIPTLFLIGDSTVKNPLPGLEGWGDAIAPYFDTSRIRIENCALGGRSSRSYLTEGHWAKVLEQIKPGDFVLMQFGHNDGGPLDHGPARASLKGVGDETKTVTMQATGKVEVVHTYGWYMRHYILDAKSKGAIPIVVSPIPRNIWSKENKVLTNERDYGGWAKEAAQQTGAYFIDLNHIIAGYYNEMGPIMVKRFFPGDHTHTSPTGAALNADCVVQGLRALPNCPLKAYLKSEIGPTR
jgi:rhamnogalacturonan acetylesterase